MNLSPFEGFIIPGLHFDQCTVWVLKWETNPTLFNEMIEVWVLWHNGKKTCYISPSEADVVFKKYHNFDEIIPADISVSETKSNILIDVTTSNISVLSLQLFYKRTLKYSLLNFLLKYGNRDRFAEKGKTETRMNYKSMPKRIYPLTIAKAKMNDENMRIVEDSPVEYSLGDGKSSKDPIINYCIHMLED